MATNDYRPIETPRNYEEKTLCVLVLDTSGSMKGKPIEALNEGVRSFHKEISEDKTLQQRLELAIVEFNDKVNVKEVCRPALAEDFEAPTFTAGGLTATADAVNLAIDIVARRKNEYKQTGQPYLRPWIVLMTDGVPDDDQDMDALARRIDEDTRNKRYAFLPIGVGDQVNMDVLQKIEDRNTNNPKMGGRLTAKKLNGLKFVDFFAWLSASIEVDKGNEAGSEVATPQDDPTPTPNSEDIFGI